MYIGPKSHTPIKYSVLKYCFGQIEAHANDKHLSKSLRESDVL